MIRLKLVIILLLTAAPCFAQPRLSPDSLIYSFLTDITDGTFPKPCLGFDSIPGSVITMLKTALAKKSFSDHAKTITLTKSEIDSIKSCLQSLDPGWLTKNFGNTILAGPGSRTKPRGISYQFSKPVFLRNNQICLFYFGLVCPGCSQQKFSFYIHQKGKWTSYLTILLIQE